MKRRKCFKTILSGLLAAAMLVTAAPVNSFTVSAAQVETEITEETPVSELSTVPEPEGQTGTVEVPEISNDGAEGEGGEITEPATPPETPTEVQSPVVSGTSVTFNYDGTEVPADTNVYVKGQMNSWNLQKMNKEVSSNVFTATFTDLKVGKYEYGFQIGEDSSNFKTDPKNPLHVNDDGSGNSIFIIKGLVDTQISAVKGKETALPLQLDAYTENSGKETEKVNVQYKLPENSPNGITLTTAEDGKQVLAIGAELDESVTSCNLIAEESNNTANTCTVKVMIQAKEYTEDPTVQSPIPGKGQATFNYFAPNAGTVEIKGQMTGWEKKSMTFNKETGYWSITLKMDAGTYEYGFVVDGKDNEFKHDPLNKGEKASNGNDLVIVTENDADRPVSPWPKVEGTSVTFKYENSSLTDDTKVSVLGTLNNWQKHADGYVMTNTATGVWEITLSDMAPGSYEYKFFYGDPSTDDGYVNDPLNEYPLQSNNNVFYIAGLKKAGEDSIVKIGKSTQLPEKWTLYEANGITSEVAVTYALSDETKAAAYADKITLSPEDRTVSVSEDFPTDVESFTLTATAQDAEGNALTATFPVKVVEAIYKYTIYYYDPVHPTIKDAALWIWETDGAGATAPTYFTETEELADGNSWLKTTIEVSYTNLSIIPRGYNSWDDWKQDATRTYTNTDGEDKTLYIVYKDGAGASNIYTTLPEIVQQEMRYIIAEYTRTTKTASEWYFYTWNNGDKDFNKFEGDGAAKIATVPVAQGIDTISFCLERTWEATDTLPEGTKVGDHWAEKDGGDHIVDIPLDQDVIKIKIEEGKGIVGAYPYNIGYEIAPKEKKIHFYYRNDEKFKEGSTGGYESVQIEINDTTYNMTWDAETQRYVYDLENLVPGTYNYRYILKETAASDAETVLDKFNDVKTADEKYSVCEYKLFEATVTASVFNKDMDYNDNNVLSISFTGKDGAEVPDMEAASVTADLTALGGGVTSVDPKLMELSIAVKEGTEAGEKKIPVTVIDQFANEYTTEATVNVVDRNKGADFDWDEAVIYFTVTDRFFDGNASNNGIGYDTNAATGPSSYHGGDFAGLTEKLDYLKELGVNTIWITPIVEQQATANVDGDTGILSWGYHGYWASNFEKLDSHLGTEEEFKSLLDAAHARGMKIMVDVVLNHSGYGQESYFNSLLKDEEGNPIRMIRENSEMVDGNDQLSSLSGLPDFLTENDEVRELLVEWQSKWISKYDIDYYRVDTVKHVDNTTWSAFKNALTKIDPDFKMIGEWAGGGYGTSNGILRGGRMDSLLDFDYNDNALDFATGKISETENFLNARNAAIDNTATLGAFLGSHDEDGYIHRLVNERKVPADKATDLAKVAASLQITSKGQVVVYYGEELGMTGANNYPYQTNRYDFDWAQANEGNATYVHYKKMLAIRNKYSEVLAKGSRKTIEASNEKGLDVFQRSLAGTTLTVGLNITDKEIEYTVAGLTPSTMYTDCYAGTRYVSDENGNVTVIIPAAADGGTVVLAEGEFEERFIINQIPDQTYTGKNITLSAAQLKVYYGLTELKAGTDYTVKYKNNKTVGTATITVTGKGNYTGKETTTFNIVPKDIKDTDIVYQDAMIATGGKLKPLSKITHNGIKLGTKDYKAEYFALDENGNKINANEPLATIKDAGDYELVITALRDEENNKGNFTGSTTKKIKVYAKGSVSYMKNTTITLSKKSYEYTGAEIVLGDDLTVKAKSGSKPTLIPDTDYKVSYENNVEVGTATVIITGIPKEGGYIGSVTKTFKITGVKLSSVAQVDETNWQQSVVYDVVSGKAVQSSEVGLQAKNGTDTFTEGKDYTVSYQKNDKPGSATMVFTGKGKYTGTVTKKFTVAKINLTADDVRLKYTVAATAPYAKKGAKAAVTVKYDGILLREGVDYKLTYGNNKVLTTEATAANKLPNVKITGIGAFAGNIQNLNPEDAKHTTFSIVKSDLGTLKLTAVDKVFKNSNGAFISAPVLTEDTGAKLANNKDYEVKYYVTGTDGNDEEKGKTDTVAVGENGYTTVKMVATAKESGNYVGTITTTYRVVTANISKASVKVNAKVYTGKAITLDEQDFTKIKVGTTDLVYGKDYEIVKDSYVNNIKKGTASVTIKGLGNYGGTKKVTFKITNRTIAWWWNLLQ